MKTAGELRSGFTTGSAMTAAAVAAYLNLRDRVAILLPAAERSTFRSRGGGRTAPRSSRTAATTRM